MPYILLAASSMLFALVFREKNAPAKARKQGVSIFCSAAVLAATVLISCLMWEADADYRAETSMYRALLRQDWKTVVQIYDKVVKREDAANERSYAALMKQVKTLGGDDRRNLYSQYYYETYEQPSRLMSEMRMIAIACAVIVTGTTESPFTCSSRKRFIKDSFASFARDKSSVFPKTPNIFSQSE